MTDARESDPDGLFAAWVERGGGEGFDAFVGRHPEHADELRRMHSDWRLFAPLLAHAVPGAIAEGEDAARPPHSGDEGEASEPPSDELLSRLGIRLPESGRYRFQKVIGQGGGGVVLRVWDAKLQRALAMKVVLGRGELRPTGETPPVDAAALTRFVDEARIASQLDHPGIVPVHELGTDASGRAFFTMRLVRGEDLGKILARARRGEPEWTQARLLGILVRVCEAVGYAHEKGVVHRDLKPGNVMVGRHGEVHVMDWGLARAGGAAGGAAGGPLDPAALRSGVRSVRGEEREASPESPLLTGAGSVVGTPAYMSPEQARGEHARVDARSDGYALGAMLYELLAGEPPFVPHDARVPAGLVLMRVIEGPPAALADKAPRAPEELVAICERAMAREPAQRYRDMGALERDLRAFLEGRVVAAYESGTWAQTRKWMRRNPTLAAALAGLIVVLALGLVLSTVLTREARDAQAESERLLRGASRDALRHADRAIAASKSGEAGVRHEQLIDGLLHLGRALELDPTNGVAWERLALELGAVRAPLHPTRVLPHDGAIADVQFSRDGSFVLTASEDGTATIWDAVTGELSTRMRHDAPVGSASFCRGDSHVLTVADDTVTLWDRRVADPVREWKHPRAVRQAVLGQDDALLATLCADGQLRVWEVETDRPRFQHRLREDDSLYSASLAFLPRDRILTSDSSGVRLWDLATGAQRPAGSLGNHSGGVVASDRLLAANDGGGTDLFDIDSMAKLATVDGYVAAVSPDGTEVVTTDYYGQRVRRLSAADGRALASLGVDAYRASYSFDGLQVALLGGERVVTVWRDDDLPLVHSSRVTATAFDRSGGRLVTGCQDGTANVWDLGLGEGLGRRVTTSNYDSVQSVFSSDGEHVITFSGNELTVVRADTWEQQDDDYSIQPADWHRVFTDHGQFLGEGRRLRFDAPELVEASKVPPLGRSRGPSCFSADGSRVVATGDHHTTVWDLERFEPLLEIPHASAGARNACLTPRGDRVVIVSADGSARVREVATGEVVVALEGQVPGEMPVVSPTGEFLAEQHGRNVLLWDLKTGQRSSDLTHRDVVGAHGVRFWGRHLVVVDGSGGVTVRTAESSPREVLAVEHEGCWWAELSSDGARLLTAGRRNVALWDAQTGERLFQLAAETGWGAHAKFDARGRRVIADFLSHLGSEFSALLDLGGAQDLRAAAATVDVGDVLDLIHFTTGSVLDPAGKIESLSIAEWSALSRRVGQRRLQASPLTALEAYCSMRGPDAAAAVGSGWTRRALADASIAGEAVADYFALDPGNPLVQIAKAAAADGARADFLRAYGLAQLPPDAAIRVRAARLLLAQGDVARSVEAARLALEVSPRNLEAARLAATADAEALLDDVLPECASLQQAEEALQARTDTNPIVRDVARERLPLRAAGAETWVNQLFFACPLKEEVEALLMADRERPSYLRTEALAKLSAMSEWPGVLNDFAWTIATGDESSDGSRIELASRAAQRAVELSPNIPNYVNTLGVTLYRAGRIEEALECLQQSDEARRERGEPRIVEDVVFIAMALWRLGCREDARAELRAVEPLMSPDSTLHLQFLCEAQALIR